MRDLIIIGAGPAGITAGIYAARKKLKTLILTKDLVGQLGKTSLVENWPGMINISGQELMNSFLEHLKKYDIEIKKEEVEKIEKGFSVNSYKSKAVILATGSTPRKLNVRGEERLIGKGVSFCALCDAPFFKDKKVLIVGGGNAGFEAGLDLAKYAKKIVIAERGEKVKADALLQQRAKEIEVYIKEQIEEIKGKERVESVVFSQRGEEKFDGVFIEIGSAANSNLAKDLVELNERGEIKADEYGRTSLKGFFAAGDVRESKYKQIVIAASEGAKAALSAYEYLCQRGAKT